MLLWLRLFPFCTMALLSRPDGPGDSSPLVAAPCRDWERPNERENTL